MRTKLFKTCLWLVMIVCSMSMSAQADPTFTEVNTTTDALTVVNLGDADVDLSTYWVCLGPGTYRQIGSLPITLGDLDLSPNEAVTFTYDLINESTGGLGLFSTNTFGSSDPAILVDYLQWGAANQARVGQAVTAGRWDNAANFVDGPSPYTTDVGGSAAAWNIAMADPTFTVVNTTTDALTIANLGDTDVDLSTYWVCLGPGTYRQIGTLPITSGDLDLSPNEAVTFTYDLINESTGGLGLFSTNTFGSSDPTILVDYVQWGAANQARVGQAVTAGRWDNAANFVDGPSPYTTDVGGSAAAWNVAMTDPTFTLLDTTSDALTITNLGDLDVDLSTYWVCLGPGTYRQIGSLPIIDGDFDLSPNEAVTFTYDLINESTGGLGLFSTNTFGSSDPTILVDYVQWGVANQARVGQAVTAGRWDSAANFVDGDSPYTTDIGGSAAAWNSCEAFAGEITFDPVGINNTTSINEDGTSAVICLDGNADPLNVTVEPGGVGTNSGFIITDQATGEILGLPMAPPFNLDGAGVGVCDIWYIRYEDGLLGKEVGSNIDDLLGCFDLSDPIEVIREEADGGTVAIDIEATGNPNNTTSVSADGLSAVICVDGNADPLIVIHENDSPNLSYRYVITDNSPESIILAISGSNAIDLDGAGIGTCQIWGWSYRGTPDNGAGFIGGPLADLDAEDCSDISDNSIEVIREEADGGTVAIDIEATGNPNNTTSVSADGLSAVICVDGNADPLIVIHENDSPNLSYRYVITDNSPESIILAISGSNAIDLDGAGIGTCQIWGWSYRGTPDNGAGFIGGPLADLDAEDCSDISDNSIEVIREEADGGTVAIDIEATGNPNNTTSVSADGLSAVICVDGNADPLIVIHENDSPNLSYRYVITDNSPESIILAISGSNAIDLDGAGIGTCQIWGWSYRGTPDNGAGFIGGPLADLDAEDCSDISENSIEVIREEADGGTVAIDIEATGNPNNTTSVSADGLSAVICVDGNADPLIVIHENDSPNLSYRYVITDNSPESIILAISGSNAIDLDGAGIGTCQIWGWSYRGTPDNGAGFIGGPLADLDAEDCSDISDNSIEVIREEADGGTVAIDIEATEAIGEETTLISNETSATIIAGDDIANPIIVVHENDSPNLSYRYVITDNSPESIILAISGTNEIDLDGAGIGTCQIWGWSYRGTPDNGAGFIGGPLADLDAEDCSDISENSIEVVRTTTLAVEDNQIDISLRLFPNPTTDFINITTQSRNGYQATIYSITGQQIMSRTFTTSENRLDVSRFSNGMYLLEIVDQDTNTRSIQRFIKN